MMRRTWFIALALLLCAAALWAQYKPSSKHIKPRKLHVFPANLVTVPSNSPLYQIKIMVRTGSADDPAGKEGIANLAAQALIEGGFGNPQDPINTQKLAEITRPWGEAAFPTVLVDKQATTFSMTVPRDSFALYIERVLKPMFNQPLSLFQHHFRHLHVPGGGFVKGRTDDLTLHGPLHVSDFFRPLVDQQHDQRNFRMIGGHGVGDALQEHGLAGARWRHNEAALTFTDGREQVEDAR